MYKLRAIFMLLVSACPRRQNVNEVFFQFGVLLVQKAKYFIAHNEKICNKVTRLNNVKQNAKRRKTRRQ